MDVSALRAEIKAWEKDFNKQNGRDPTVQDIKDTPGMPGKYKLYKKLSKQHAGSSAAVSSSTAPFPIPADRRAATPPRQSSSSILSKHKSRAVKAGASEFSNNPFSPVKNKGKERALIALDSLSISTSSRANANPFATPRKTKTQSHTNAHEQVDVPRRDPSPDPFPLISAQPPRTPSSHQTIVPQHTLDLTIAQSQAYRDVPAISVSSPAEYSETPVTRARKRLRGEPVAPSPVKEKRARVFSQSSSLLASRRYGTLLDCSGDEDAIELGKTENGDGDEDEDTFFGESPVKRPSEGKQFKLLFDESDVTLVQQPIKPKAQSRTKSALFIGLPFAKERSNGSARMKPSSRAVSPEDSDADMDVDWAAQGGKKIKALDVSLSEQPEKKSRNARAGLPRAMLPGKDDLWAPAPAPPTSGTHTGKAALISTRITTNGAKAGPSRSTELSRAAKKRSLSDDEMDVDEPSVVANPVQERLTRSLSQAQLLPPSPPLDSRTSSRTSARGRTNGFPANSSRKKAKLLEELATGEDEESVEDEDEDVHVKERLWSWNAHKRASESTAATVNADLRVEGDSEPEFDPTLYRPAPAPISVLEEEGTLEVKVPEKLREVLAIDVERQTKTYDLDEKRLARVLIYGRREGHYDAQRGGEIWEVGEVGGDEEEAEDGRKDDDTDEWEGEPVPWEVGEL